MIGNNNTKRNLLIAAAGVSVATGLFLISKSPKAKRFLKNCLRGSLGLNSVDACNKEEDNWENAHFINSNQYKKNKYEPAPSSNVWADDWHSE